MQRRTLFIATAGLVFASLAPAAVAQPESGLSADEVRVLSTGSQLVDKATSTAKAPAGPNPMLALLPDPSTVDYTGWKTYLEARAKAEQPSLRSQAFAAAADSAPASATPDRARPIEVVEDEDIGENGENDTPGDAERIKRFRVPDRNAALVAGTLSNQERVLFATIDSEEDDGSIPLANDTGIGGSRDGVEVSAEIGDGPHGSSGTGSGDYDVYAVSGDAGQGLIAETSTPTGPLDTMLAVYDADGNEVAFNDDSSGFDSRVSYTLPDDGTYYLLVTGFFSLPDDPFDSGSGSGADSEGPYDLEISVQALDVDVFAVRLSGGDVLSGVVEAGANQVSILDPSGDNVHGSTQDASSLYPAETPLPGGGNAVSEHVADESGWHYVEVTGGEGAYRLLVEAYRPGLEGERSVQTLFLDFDGERVQTAIFGGPGVRELSPLEDFIADWGLRRRHYDDLVDEIVATVRENVKRDLRRSGLNDDFRVRIRNSEDHPDTFGDDNVSRVIVGGTIEESGIPTIGIAETIDPGNFGTEESALVLLDVLSGPEDDDASLNAYLTEESDRIAFVGQAIGNVTSHEAGHFFGNWHVDQFDDTLNLMDQGGNFPLLYGVGDDGIGGTADDPDVDFGEDTFNPNEGFTGTEDTASRIAEVLTR